jgi:ATP phosphoribosyltransferase regulatory subunit
MNTYDLITPAGTSDLLPLEVKKLRAAERALSELFEENGFSEIVTTELEFMDVFNLKSRHFPPEGLYKSTDDKGRVLSLRPDSTMPIARLAATRLKSFDTLKLYYNQKVYRNSPSKRRRNDEIRQMGVELIGFSGEKSDFDICKLALRVFELLPPDKNAVLEIGDIGISKMLIDLLPVTDDKKELIRTAIEAKNTPELHELLSDIDTDIDSGIIAAIRVLPELFGGEEVFDRIHKLINIPNITESIEKLHRFYNELTAVNTRRNTYITVDFGFTNKMDYYTGIIMRGYVENAGEAVINGGRYDNLIAEFDPGCNKAAVGFAVNMGLFAESLSARYVRHPLRIALTKGRLEKKAIELFEKIGFDCSEVHEKGRRLILKITKDKTVLEVVLAKPNDVITYVESGVCDLGVVGKDTIIEDGGKFFELRDLGFGRCRFAVAGKAGEKGITPIKTIATKYPAVARAYFDRQGADIDIVKIEGSVELAPLLGLSDAIVDIVETGSTLKENGLEVYDDIVKLSARLIANRVSLKMYADIDSILNDIEPILSGS